MASVDEYGYVTLDENADSRGDNNPNNRNDSNGSSWGTAVLGIFSLLALIGLAVIGFDSYQNGTFSSSQNQEENSSLNSNSDTAYETGEYILPNSDSAYISESDLFNLTQTEVALARNEIYARHGRIFTKDSIREYFESKTWYEPYIDPDDFSDSVFNEYERENIDVIVRYEMEKGWR